MTTSTGGDWAAMAVPPRLAVIYRLVRLIRLVARYFNRARRGA